MPRGKKRTTTLTTTEIKTTIEQNNKTIEDLMSQIKAIRLENKSLAKDFAVAEAKEKEEAEKKELEEIAEIIKNSGKSIDQIKGLLKIKLPGNIMSPDSIF